MLFISRPIITLLILAVVSSSIFFIAPVENTEAHPYEGHSHIYEVAASPWAEHLETFQQLLRADPKAARIELQNVAEDLFGEHTLREEWVVLFFRISKDGTKDISDVQRLHELEIRMLTAIDAKKYAQQIQQHQEALADLTEPDAVLGDEDLKAPIDAEPPPLSQTTSKTISDIAYKTFFQLVADNKEAANAMLDIYALISFENHPLSKEWKTLFYQLCRNQEATHSEASRLFELRKQMLTDNDPKKYAKEIKRLSGMLNKMKLTQKLLERHGEADEKFPFTVAPE